MYVLFFLYSLHSSSHWHAISETATECCQCHCTSTRSSFHDKSTRTAAHTVRSTNELYVNTCVCILPTQLLYCTLCTKLHAFSNACPRGRALASMCEIFASANERRYEFARITLVAFICRFFSSSLMLNSIEYVLTMQAHSHTHLNEVRDMRYAFSSAHAQAP